MRFRRTRPALGGASSSAPPEFRREFMITSLVVAVVAIAVTFINQFLSLFLNFWRIILLNHVTRLESLVGSPAEPVVVLVFSLVLISLVAWFRVWRKRKRTVEESSRFIERAKKRRWRPVYLPEYVSRWQMGFIVSTQELQLGLEDDAPILFMPAVVIPAYPIPATGQKVYLPEEALIFIHNSWDEIALYFASAAHMKVRWRLTDHKGNAPNLQDFVLRFPKLTTFDPEDIE